MKKILIFVILLITSIGANCFDLEQSENICDTISEQQVNDNENHVETLKDINENEIITEIQGNVATVEEIKQEEIIPKEDIEKQESKPVPKENKNLKNNLQDSNNQKTSGKVIEIRPQEESSHSNKSEESNADVENKELTESDLLYWCVEGGNHHVAGDGVNEHGYYSSWDAAYQAFENYTQDWDSVQFKVGQCACGKYYFWAIK